MRIYWFDEDVPVAKVEMVEFSGMWTVQQKADALDRVDVLLQAIKKARQRANTAEVVDGHIGAALTAFIVSGATPAK